MVLKTSLLETVQGFQSVSGVVMGEFLIAFEYYNFYGNSIILSRSKKPKGNHTKVSYGGLIL